MSGWSAATLTEYCVSVRLIRHQSPTNIGLVSGWPVSIPTEYYVSVQRFRHHHQSILHWCRLIGATLTDIVSVSANLTPSPYNIVLDVRLIKLQYWLNIVSVSPNPTPYQPILDWVSGCLWASYWILCQCPTIRHHTNQYCIGCPADQLQHWLNIVSVSA